MSSSAAAAAAAAPARPARPASKPRKKAKSGTNIINDHFILLDDQRHKCKHCGNGKPPYSSTTGNGTLRNHLKEQHRAVWDAWHREHDSEDPAEEPAAAAAASSSAAAATAMELVDDHSSAAGVRSPQRAASSATVLSSSSSAAVAAAAAPSAGKRKAPSSAASVATPRITAHFSASQDSVLYELIALAFSVRGIAHSIIDAPEFRAMLDAVRHSTKLPPTRLTLRDSVTALASSLRSRVLSQLSSAAAPVSIALDGWTNVRHDKVLNIVPISAGVAFYWCSIVNSLESSTALWLYNAIKPVLLQMKDDGIRFVAFVADNESTMNALHTLLQKPTADRPADFPFLIRVPCCAHTIQLIVKRVMKQKKDGALIAACSALIALFDKNKQHRLELKRLQQQEPHCYPLVKPCETRWSSSLACIERLLLLKRHINFIVPKGDAFWTELAELAAFLVPFSTATDVIQRDSSTLFDVYKQFAALLAHAKQHKPSGSAVASIKKEWKNHVNEPATVACALLSCEPKEQWTPAQQDAARAFILDFGSDYIAYYELAAAGVNVRATLVRQLGQFWNKVGAFASLEQTLADVRDAQLIANMKVVNGQTVSWWDPKDVWYHATVLSPELSTVALALLSVAASEASVERTFSAQGSIHSKSRNRLLDDIVESELFVRFNHRALARPAAVSGSLVRLEPEGADGDGVVALFGDEADEPEEEEEPAVSEESKESDADAAPAAAAAAAAPRASPDELAAAADTFMHWYISARGLNKAAAKRLGQADRLNDLTDQLLQHEIDVTPNDMIAMIKDHFAA